MIKLIKSYKFWTSLAGSVGLVLTAMSDTFGISINVSGVKEIIMTLCGVLIVFGVVKKPVQENKENQEQKDADESQN